MSETIEKFEDLLADLLMLNRVDLDFGIYRIMNEKRDQIMRFLQTDLRIQVRQILAKLQSGSREQIENRLAHAIAQAEDLGINPETTERVKQLRRELITSTDTSAGEEEVFSRLYEFFSRYYSEGDFLSLRRYKAGVYSIPYEGEEVKLHWANADQYYIKTSENFRDYTFRLADHRRVHFRIADAEIQADNNKAATNQESRFILRQHPIQLEAGELFIFFEFRPDEFKRTQAELNRRAVADLFGNLDLIDWLPGLTSKSPTEKNTDRTLLDKHLNEYTARNTFDYFIHKDLFSFLRRELDFYIKNEVMFLDDLESDTIPRVEQYLATIKALRSIAHRIIDFLAQLEEFQKKLWLKKKFVLNTNYCLTLDRVPAEFYEEILRNEEQIGEWIKLFCIDEIKGDLVHPGYSKPLSVEFLRTNPYLLLDTKFFSQDFKDRLLAGFENLDEQLDGLLLNSENFQALNLLTARYEGKIESIYIDPPYNTGPSEIVYKNNYKDSSWLSLLRDRLLNSSYLLAEEASIAIAIDDYAMVRLSEMCDELLPGYERNLVIVNHHPQGSGGKNISRTHEYMIYLVPRGADLLRGKTKQSQIELRSFMLSGPGENKSREGRPNSFYALLLDVEKRKVVGVEAPPSNGCPYPTIDTPEGYKRVYPIGSSGREQVWCRSFESARVALDRGEIVVSDNLSIKLSVDTTGKRSLLFSNWINSKYNAGPHGTKLISDILGSSDLFSYPKSIYLVEDAIDAMTWHKDGPTILDYFAGSGTTAHAIINLNREDGGNRKFVLVEMGNYFKTVLKPRIQRVIYSKDWKDGKPLSRKGSSHFFKYLKLESYEDTLNNLEAKQSPQQSLLIEANQGFREDYILRYMLDTETRGSTSLLNLDEFKDPFNYTLYVPTSDTDELGPVNVDLVETFNYLIGLRVRHIDSIDGFKTVEGIDPSGGRVLVIWRSLEKKSNSDLDTFFQKQAYRTGKIDFDLIYVNGDNNLENLRRPNETWKVRVTESEFQRLMFETPNF